MNRFVSAMASGAVVTLCTCAYSPCLRSLPASLIPKHSKGSKQASKQSSLRFSSHSTTCVKASRKPGSSNEKNEQKKKKKKGRGAHGEQKED
ncbi:hypothetical protein IWZ03DRAFT_202143 [Phyllosticta citriasiana]|uniref:Secreted protein n=1 Tax=Phyllosticta citriasiana TaxID=595635 RepID=A0ABR1KJQ9_9PEZI